MNKKHVLTSLISPRTLQKIQDNFSIALGIPLSIRDPEGNLLTKISNTSHLWELVKDHPDTDGILKTILKESFEKSKRTGQIVIFQRYLDTYTFATPIHVHGKIVAFFVGGLVRFGNPDLEKLSEEAKKLNVHLDTFLEAYLELALFTKDRLEAAANLLKIISTTISSLEFEGSILKIKKRKNKNKQHENHNAISTSAKNNQEQTKNP